MAQTRSKTRGLRTRKQIYRKRVKTSPCRGETVDGCRKKYGCVRTKAGNRRAYCRKRTNRHA
jgi:hypothetical protein